VPSAKDRALDSVLLPRSAADGGPVTLLPCRACREEGLLETLPDGKPLIAPREAGKLPPAAILPSLLLGSREAARREQARAWVKRWAEAFEELRARRFRGEEPRSPPPPPPPPPAAPTPLDESPSTDAEARVLLGVTPDADMAHIDAAFRKLSRKCHPDLVAHLDPDFQALAHRKFLLLKAAHDRLRGKKHS
jgi:hypothetical protein